MAEIRISHRDLIDNIQGLNNFGKQRAAAALFSGDADGNMRVDHAELSAAIRSVQTDRQLDQPARNAVVNALQEVFTRLGSPAQCKRGVPHQRMVENLTELNTFGKQRAAAALFSADADTDLCVTHAELAGALRSVGIDRQLDQPNRNVVGNNMQLAFTRLSPPKCSVGGVNARCGAPAPKTMVSE
jgi:hypothetical protein